MTERTKYQSFEAVELHRRDIHGAPWNPRAISPANRSRLKRGLKKHGIVDGIIVNKRTGNIVGGHQRLSVLDELEGTDDYTITVQQIDVDENEEMLLNMSLNNPSLQGHFESDLQRQLFEHLVSEGVDLEGAGYTTTDVQVMFPDIFASGQLAEQLEAEADIVNTLHQVAQVGKEYEATFREQMGIEPRSGSVAAQVKSDDAGSVHATQQSSSDGVHWEDVDAPAPVSQNTGEQWYADKDYFKKERQRTVDQNAEVKAEADVMLTFVFQTKAQREGFMKAFNLEASKRYFDVVDVMAAFGIEL